MYLLIYLGVSRRIPRLVDRKINNNMVTKCNEVNYFIVHFIVIRLTTVQYEASYFTLCIDLCVFRF